MDMWTGIVHGHSATFGRFFKEEISGSIAKASARAYSSSTGSSLFMGSVTPPGGCRVTASSVPICVPSLVGGWCLSHTNWSATAALLSMTVGSSVGVLPSVVVFGLLLNVLPDGGCSPGSWCVCLESVGQDCCSLRGRPCRRRRWSLVQNCATIGVSMSLLLQQQELLAQ